MTLWQGREDQNAEKVIATYTPEHINALLATCRPQEFAGKRDIAIILLLADCGLRISELCSLTLIDIDWTEQTFLVHGKGNKERRVPFGKAVRSALHPLEHPKEISMNQAIAYVRVSTDEQAREGVSLSAQEERLRGYCLMSGLPIATVIREEGVSGRTPISNRPGGKAMLKLIREKQVQHVVALKLDRLFRDAEDALRQTRQWNETPIALHLVDMGGTAINTASAMGRLLITMMSGFAELERNLIAERTAAALQHKKQHRQVYSPTPYGFQREGDILIPDPVEMAVIVCIRVLHTDGASLRAIAAQLNTERIPAKKGGRWNVSTIWYLLRNSQYLEK